MALCCYSSWVGNICWVDGEDEVEIWDLLHSRVPDYVQSTIIRRRVPSVQANNSYQAPRKYGPTLQFILDKERDQDGSDYGPCTSDIMLGLIFKWMFSFAIFWAFYRVLRRLVVKTALDNIPGPPSPSFFKGTCTLNSNNVRHKRPVR